MATELLNGGFIPEWTNGTQTNMLSNISYLNAPESTLSPTQQIIGGGAALSVCPECVGGPVCSLQSQLADYTQIGNPVTFTGSAVNFGTFGTTSVLGCTNNSSYSTFNGGCTSIDENSQGICGGACPEGVCTGPFPQTSTNNGGILLYNANNLSDFDSNNSWLFNQEGAGSMVWTPNPAVFPSANTTSLMACWSSTSQSPQSNQGNLVFQTYPGPSSFSQNPNPNCQFISDYNRFKCCTANPNSGSSTQFNQQCGSLFTPGGTNSLCPSFMNNECLSFWLSGATATSSTQQVCSNYINLNYAQNNSDVCKVVENIFQNQITNTGRYPNDYVSNTVNNTGISSSNILPAGRNDSTDAFFTQTLPNLMSQVPCAFASNNSLLNEFCAQFTRDDLTSDPTLNKICGCYMSTSANTSYQNALGLSNTTVQPNQYIYSPWVTQQCDPLCALTGTIKTGSGTCGQNNCTSGMCSQTVCLMEDIDIQVINSNSNISLSEMCSSMVNGSGGDSICVMDNVNVDEINSVGSINLQQNCKTCAIGSSTTGWKIVDCSSLGPQNGSGSSGGQLAASGWESRIMLWIRENKGWAIAIAVLFIALIIVIILLIHDRKH